jgi:hypothetical protein
VDGSLADTVWGLSGLMPAIEYFWRVKAQNALGESDWSPFWSFTTVNPVKVSERADVVPEKITLDLYPNPFNSSATVHFSLPRRQHVTLKVFDVFGREKATLADGESNQGEHSVVFEAENLASGVYVIWFNTGQNSRTRKAILMR